MSVKRYEVNGSSSVFENENGSLVDYEDYAALEARCTALAAENAGLKEEISNITFMRDDDFFGSTQRAQEVMGRLVNFKAPATDAFLAEVRAQGVEMLVKHCEQKALEKSYDFFMDAGAVAAQFAEQLRKGVQS